MRPLTRIDRYLCRAMLSAAGTVLLALIALISVFASSRNSTKGAAPTDSPKRLGTSS